MADECTTHAYAQAIPVWCGRRRMQEHIDMMLCWSLAQRVARGERMPKRECERCDLRDRTAFVPADVAGQAKP